LPLGSQKGHIYLMVISFIINLAPNFEIL
jgi:hypothetical protein